MVKTYGTRQEVMNGEALLTNGGLARHDMAKVGNRIISLKKREAGLKYADEFVRRNKMRTDTMKLQKRLYERIQMLEDPDQQDDECDEIYNELAQIESMRKPITI